MHVAYAAIDIYGGHHCGGAGRMTLGGCGNRRHASGKRVGV